MAGQSPQLSGRELHFQVMGALNQIQEKPELGPAAQNPNKEGPIPSLLPPSRLDSSLVCPCQAVLP